MNALLEQNEVFINENDDVEEIIHSIDTDLTNDPWKNFSYAIIQQAARDYLLDGVKLNEQNIKEKEKRHLIADMRSIRKFFRGDLYYSLTNISPEYLIKQLDDKIERLTGQNEFI